MTYRVRDIAELMEQLAPQRLAEAWDNVGLLTGSGRKPVSKILVTLDVTQKVIEEAVRKKADLVISHHPVIFRPVKAVNDESWVTSIVMELLRADIPVFCAHTNLDKACGGMDDALAECLGLVDIKPLTYADNDPAQPLFGRIGTLPESVSLREYLNKTKSLLGAVNVSYTGDENKEVRVVASCAGAGGDFLTEAAKAGADLYITGELKHHDAVAARDLNIAAAVFGHYTTEKPGISKLIIRLQNLINTLQYNIDVIPSEDYCDPFCSLQE